MSLKVVIVVVVVLVLVVLVTHYKFVKIRTMKYRWCILHKYGSTMLCKYTTVYYLYIHGFCSG